MLLVLPALLAAMGGAQNSACASLGVEPVADLAVTTDRDSVDSSAQTAAVATPLPTGPEQSPPPEDSLTEGPVPGGAADEAAPSAPSRIDPAEPENPAAGTTSAPDAVSGELSGPLASAAEVDPDTLAQLRGGFEGPGGLQVSFGIEQMVVVNGVLLSHTQMSLNDVGRGVAAGANAGNALPLPGTVTLVQNGVNNSMLANLPAATLATVVQNSLDNQHLQTITRINATVNSGWLLQLTRLQQSVQDVLNRAALGH